MYYINKNRTIVHYGGCTRLGKAQPWDWAQGKSDALIATYMSSKGISPCRLCYPPLYPSKSSLRVVV